MLSTLGMDGWRMIAFYNLTAENIELASFVNFTAKDTENDGTHPIDSEQTPFSQYSDIIEKEPQCFNAHFSWLKVKLALSVLTFFLHFSWQNIFLETLFTPPEV